jgi:Fe-S cluster assembly protein SufD
MPRSTRLTPFNIEEAAGLPGPEWLRELRVAAARRYSDLSPPTDALEEWRYSRIDSLDPEGFAQAAASDVRSAPDDPALAELLADLGPKMTAETLNGYAVGAVPVSPGMRAEVLSAPGALRPAGWDDPVTADAFATLNSAFAPDPLRISLEGRHQEPLVIVHRLAGEGLAVFPRVQIEAHEDSETMVVEVVAGGGANLLVPVTDIVVSPGARLSYLHLQLLGSEAWQIALQSSHVGAGGMLSSAAAALGGSYARLKTDSTLAGPGAESRLLALYFASGSQMHDFRTVQRHAAGRTRSDLLYKGVVANTARSVYSGLIRVEKGAGGSNAFQANRNLVLHEGAHADSVPNLEIEDNDVRCSHASAVGPVAEDQRFYLEARGVPPAAAERLIALGFLDEVIDEVSPRSIGGSLRRLVESKLAAAEEAELPAIEATGQQGAGQQGAGQQGAVQHGGTGG